jgi:hypothetical protein
VASLSLPEPQLIDLSADHVHTLGIDPGVCMRFGGRRQGHKRSAPFCPTLDKPAGDQTMRVVLVSNIVETPVANHTAANFTLGTQHNAPQRL